MHVYTPKPGPLLDVCARVRAKVRACALCKLLPSDSFSERLEHWEKAFRKRRFMSKFLGVFLLFRLRKGVFWKRGLFRKVHLLEILENLETLEILGNPHTVEKKGESDHFPEILENLEILEILEIPPVKRPLSY